MKVPVFAIFYDRKHLGSLFRFRLFRECGFDHGVYVIDAYFIYLFSGKKKDLFLD